MDDAITVSRWQIKTMIELVDKYIDMGMPTADAEKLISIIYAWESTLEK